MKQLLNLLKTKFFWINILAGILVVAITIWATFYWMDVYTRHGESVTVPDVVNFPLDGAVGKLEDLKLEYAIRDSSYRSDIAPGFVLEQDPEANSLVKEKRKIYLTVNVMKAPQIAVPDVRGDSLSVDQISSRLRQKQFTVGELDYVSYPYRNIVLHLTLKGEKLEPLQKVKKGEVIGIVVGNGEGASDVITPNTVGLTLTEAEFLVRSNYLNVGTLYFDKTVEDSAAAVVYRQSPRVDSDYQLSMGEGIDLYLTQELPDSLISEPMDSLMNSIDADSLNTPSEVDQ